MSCVVEIDRYKQPDAYAIGFMYIPLETFSVDFITLV